MLKCFFTETCGLIKKNKRKATHLTAQPHYNSPASAHSLSCSGFAKKHTAIRSLVSTAHSWDVNKPFCSISWLCQAPFYTQHKAGPRSTCYTWWQGTCLRAGTIQSIYFLRKQNPSAFIYIHAKYFCRYWSTLHVQSHSTPLPEKESDPTRDVLHWGCSRTSGRTAVNLCWIFCAGGTIKDSKKQEEQRRLDQYWESESAENFKSWNWHWEAAEERNKRWSSAAHLELYSTDSQNPWLKTDGRDKSGRLHFPETRLHPYRDGLGLYLLPSRTKPRGLFNLKLGLPLGERCPSLAPAEQRPTKAPGLATGTAHHIPLWTKNNASENSKACFYFCQYPSPQLPTGLENQPGRQQHFFPLGYF